jgi:hypothetical protein
MNFSVLLPSRGNTGSTLEFIRPDPGDGKPQYWRESAELRISDSVWSGLPIYSAANNYPTEKNERFLEEGIGARHEDR